jgi:hypothetical protein
MRVYKTVQILIFMGMLHASLLAQQKESDGLKTQEVLVVKSYTPSLSDAFKITEGIQIPDSLKATDKVLIFKIKPVPVVSTFEPNKATPLKLKKRSSKTPFNTFFSGGIGSLSQMYLNASSVIEMDRTQRFGLNVYRDGFGKNLKNSILKSTQGFSQFGTHHNLRSTNYNANTQLQLTTQKNNYYGLYDKEWDPFFISTLDPEIRRTYFKFRTFWNWFDSYLESLSFQANVNSDNYATSEQQLAIQANFFTSLGEGEVHASTELLGQNTSCGKRFYEDQIQEFTQGLGKVGVAWIYNKKELKLKVGAGVSYLEGEVNIASKFNFYPQLELIYNKKGKSIAPYLAANGGVNLSSYRETALYNPYTAPITDLRPQFNKYNASLGIRSSLSSILNFDFGLLFDQVENFQFSQRLPLNLIGNNEAYRLSNAFENNYTDVDIYGVNAQIRIDLAKNNFVHFETSYRYFDLADNQTLVNIPSLQMKWQSQFQFKDIITLSFNGEVWGDRQALNHVILQNQSLESTFTEQITLPLFVRSTAHFTVKLNEQFDAFVKGRFSNSKQHGQWGYFNEPNLIILGGITYKFDFQY